MATSELTLETNTEVFKGDRVICDGVERSLEDVTEGAISLVSSIDPLGDGSLVYKHELESITPTVGATPTNNGATFATGKFSNGAVFSGAQRITNIPFSCTGGTPYSISVWAKFNSDGTFHDFLGSETTVGGLIFRRYNNNLLEVSGAGLSNGSGTTSITAAGGWYHFVLVYDGTLGTGAFKIYVNTSLDLTKDYVGALTTDTSISLGVGGVYLANYHNGMADQLEIYNRALTSTEVNTLYTQTGTKYSADFNTPLASIPTSVYRLDHDNLTIDGTPTATTATVLDSRAGLIASGDTVLLDGVGVVCNPVVEGTVVSTVVNDEFETVLYDGNGVDRTIPMANITGGVDFVWVKGRSSATNNVLIDSIRGDGAMIRSNTTDAEFTSATDYPHNLQASSFDLGNDGWVNGNSDTYVAWCASLPNHTPSNTDGTITSETKSNSFMSVVSYTGNQTSGATVGHSLGVVPELMIVKNRDSAQSWTVYNKTITATNFMYLNVNNATALLAGAWNNTEPTSTVFSIGNHNYTNLNATNIIAYCFTSVAGKCKVGSYTGTGASGNVVDCGFEPAWIMVKSTGTQDWFIYDSARTDDKILFPNQSAAEATANANMIFTATGFTVNAAFAFDDGANGPGATYIYLAIAKEVDGTIPKYDLTYPTQTAPTRIALSGNDIVPTVASETFDGTDTFTKTHNTVTKTARDVEYGFVADDEVEIVQLNINQNMEP